MKIRRFLIAGVSAGLLAATFGVSTANAAPPAGSGSDDLPNLITGGGSDTTYLVQQRLDTLYNGAPGCVLNSAVPGACLTPSTGDAKGNWDHDVTVEAAAAGSGAGIKALLGTGTYTPAIQYARSSRVPSAPELAAGVTGWGFARDAIAVVTFGARTVAISRQDLIDIYSCAKTDWSQIIDNVTGVAEAPGTIVPWDMNGASGTRTTFTDWLKAGNGGVAVAFGGCVRSLQIVPPALAGVAPFENDVKPILADVGPDGIAGTADDNPDNYVWWMSFGDWQKYPYTRNGAHAGTTVLSNLAAITNDATIANSAIVPSNGATNAGTYAILRTLYLVTKTSDASCVTTATNGTCNNATDTVYGGAAGASGAVHAFVSWLCHATAGLHTVDTVTGVNYKTEINNALAAEGFQVVPVALRTAGYGCAVAS